MAALVLPAGLLVSLLLVAPMLLFRISLNQYSATEMMVEATSAANYLRAVADPYYRQVLLTTLAHVGEEITAENTRLGMPPVPAATSRDRGAGPFRRLVLRGITVIDGTGAPPWGPVDIVVEQDRIAAMVGVGTPSKPIVLERRPPAGDHEVDCHGKFVTPGLIDCHTHIGVPYHALHGEVAPAEYVYKLWLAHGVTTVREMGCFSGLVWVTQ